ncbi:MAG: hypothetical protein Q9M08_06615, partial [Mariprofundus sp.]|nr:hypothetical protein [Mariprofundus sp.]
MKHIRVLKREAVEYQKILKLDIGDRRSSAKSGHSGLLIYALLEEPALVNCFLNNQNQLHP